MNLFLPPSPLHNTFPLFFQAHAAYCLTLPAHQRDTCRKAGEHIWSELVRGNLINVMRMKDDRNLRGFSFPLFSNCAWGAIAPHCRVDKLNRAEKRTVTVWMGETANNSVSDSETQQCCHRILRGTCWVQIWRVPSMSYQPLCYIFKKRQAINNAHFSEWVFGFTCMGKFCHSHLRWEFDKISLQPLTPLRAHPHPPSWAAWFTWVPPEQLSQQTG